eukprot:129482-Prorocentrum_minimum.AAC.6
MMRFIRLVLVGDTESRRRWDFSRSAPVKLPSTPWHLACTRRSRRARSRTSSGEREPAGAAADITRFLQLPIALFFNCFDIFPILTRAVGPNVCTLHRAVLRDVLVRRHRSLSSSASSYTFGPHSSATH